MTFDELWRRNLARNDTDISSTGSETEPSFGRDPAFGESALEDPDETETNRFLEWLEGTLLIDDLGEHEG